MQWLRTSALWAGLALIVPSLAAQEAGPVAPAIRASDPDLQLGFVYDPEPRGPMLPELTPLVTLAGYQQTEVWRLPPIEESASILNGPAIEEVPPGQPAPAATVDPVIEPAPPPPKKIWEGSVELGVNGSSGNSNNVNWRFLTNVKRSTDFTILTLNNRYINNTSNSVETAHRLFFEGRNEWKRGDSPWKFYVHETTEYDEFRDFDVRLTADVGFSYQLIKNDVVSLTSRLGPGVSHEIGGPDDSFVPEAVMGLAYEHQLTKRSKLTASADYFPDVTQFTDFRLNSQANWQVLLDEALNVSLKFGVLDRYDSTSGDAEPNDLDYSATVLWSF